MSSQRRKVKATRGSRKKEDREIQPFSPTFKMTKESPWQDVCETPFERLAYIQDTGELADVKIIFPQEDISIMTHKIVLGMSSPVFKLLLYGSFAEASENSSTVTLPDDSSEVFKILLDHIYKGVTNIENIEEAQEVYAMAHKYQIKSLMSACFKYLMNAVSTENVLVVYEFAAFYEDIELLKACVSVINSSADMVMSSEAINEVSQACMRHLLKNDAIDVSSEVIMFKALLSWIRSINDRSEFSESETGSEICENDAGKVNVSQEESETGTLAIEDGLGKVNLVKEELEKITDASFTTQSTDTSISSKSLTRLYLPNIRFLTMSTEEFCKNVLPEDLLDGEEIKVILMHIINYEFAPSLPDVVSCSHRTRRSRFAPSAMITCRLTNTSNKQRTNFDKLLPADRSCIDDLCNDGAIISVLRPTKTILFGGINLGKGKSTFVTAKSKITVSDDYQGEFARIRGDCWDFSHFKLETPIKLTANRNHFIRLTNFVSSEISKFKLGSFSNQEGDLILTGNCIQDVNIDLYYWT